MAMAIFHITSTSFLRNTNLYMLPVCSLNTLSTQHTFRSNRSHSQSISRISAVSSNYTYNIAHIPDPAEPAHVESPIAQAPLSPPPTLKKFTALLSERSPENRGFQERSRKCNFDTLLLSKGTRRVQLRVLYIVVTLLGLFCWWRSGYIQDLGGLKQRANHLTKDLLLPSALVRWLALHRSD